MPSRAKARNLAAIILANGGGLNIPKPIPKPETPQLLATYRARLSLSQSQMAARWHVPLRTYQDIEQGKRRKDDAVLIGLLSDLLAT